MSEVVLKEYKVKEVRFYNTFGNAQQITFSNKFGYNVKYTNEGVCIGELSVEMFDKDNPEKFGVKIIICGVFNYNTELKKEQVHILSFKELFPFAKSIVATVSVNAGVPPILLPSLDMEKQSIYKFEKNI